MLGRIVTVLVSVVLLASCSFPGPAPARQSQTAPSPSPTAYEPTELERQLTAQVYALASLLKWAPNGQPAPMVIAEDAVTVGDAVTQLDVPGVTLSLRGDYKNFCMDGRVNQEGVEAVAAVYGPSGSFARETAPGQTCEEVTPQYVPVDIPQENFPGVNQFDSVLVTTGTCVDFITWDMGFGEPNQLPIVRDCADPHEYVIVEVPPLDLPADASPGDIEDVASELCIVEVRRWELATGGSSIAALYWFPTVAEYIEGDRTVNCFAQVAEDIEQTTDGTDLYPN